MDVSLYGKTVHMVRHMHMYYNVCTFIEKNWLSTITIHYCIEQDAIHTNQSGLHFVQVVYRPTCAVVRKWLAESE